MHILFLSHYFPPEVNAPAARTYEHCRRWACEKGIRVTVVTNHPNHPNGILYAGYKNRWMTREVWDGIEVIRVKTYLAPNSGVYRRALNHLFFMVAALVVAGFRITKPDVVVATSPQFFCAVAGFLASRMRRCPYVFELRDLWPESIISVGALRPGLPVRLLEKIELFLYAKAEEIICLTDSFRENLISRGVKAEKIRIIKNGVDLSFFRPIGAPIELRRELQAEGKFVVSYIGTVGMAHSLDKVITVAEKLRQSPEFLFLIVGEGAEKKKLKGIIDQKGLTNIKILSGVSREMVRHYYAVSHVNLVTLRKTPLFQTVIPSKIFESMAMARPILCSVDGECRRIVEEAGSGICLEPENVDQMVAAIRKLATDPVLLGHLGERGRRYVEKNFNRNRLAERYLNLLSATALRARHPLSIRVRSQESLRTEGL